MEDVLEIYKLPYDSKRPVICMDEMQKQLLAQIRDPIPCQAGQVAKEDDEYKRNGVADLFMVFEPLQLFVSQRKLFHFSYLGGLSEVGSTGRD